MAVVAYDFSFTVWVTKAESIAYNNQSVHVQKNVADVTVQQPFDGSEEGFKRFWDVDRWTRIC